MDAEKHQTGSCLIFEHSPPHELTRFCFTLPCASETFPTIMVTLDAIHLATALAIREVAPIDLLLTHDVQLGIAARSVGFSILGVS